MTRPGARDLTPPEISVVVSNDVVDVDDALAAVHDEFVEVGYMAPQPSGRRMHEAYLNPGTVFIVARIEGVTVGSLSLVADGPFGLPAGRAFAEELDDLRSTGREVREVGSLVIRREWRTHTRRIYLRMLAAAVRTTWIAHPEAHMVLAVAPENARFTARLFRCDILSDARPLYGAPAVLLRTDGAALRANFGADATTSSRRAMRMLVTEEDPPWLSWIRSDEPWPSDWIRPLLDEQAISDSFSRQYALMEELCPGVITATPRLPSGVGA